MNINEYKENTDVNTNYKPDLDVVEKNEEMNPTVDILKKDINGNYTILNLLPKNYNYYVKKFTKEFLKACLFKILFKIARNLDKSKSLSCEKLIDIVINGANIKFGLFVILIKIIYKLIKAVLSYFKMTDLLAYKRFNFLSGIIVNFILFPFGKKSSLVFYTCACYLIKNLFSFINSYLFNSGRVAKESKKIYYIGFTLSFVIIHLIIPSYRNEIKLLRNLQ